MYAVSSRWYRNFLSIFLKKPIYFDSIKVNSCGLYVTYNSQSWLCFEWVTVQDWWRFCYILESTFFKYYYINYCFSIFCSYYLPCPRMTSSSWHKIAYLTKVVPSLMSSCFSESFEPSNSFLIIFLWYGRRIL